MSLLAVERIKLFSTRSPWWCAALAFVLTVGFTVLIAAAAPTGELTVGATQISYPVGMVVMMVMAALAITTEHRFGTIRITFAAVPNRAAVLLSKAAVVGLLAGAVGEVTAFACWGVARLLNPEADLALDTGAEWRNVAGVGLVYALAAVLAFAVGALLRHTAGAVALLLVYTLLGENLVVLIPDYGREVKDWLPFTALDHFVAGGTPLPYGPWGGLAYFAGFAGLLLVLSVLVANRRDA